ncbi:hypothetical protein BDZ88DRAFT_389734, partial [Geranomyces variabilis]
PESLCSGCSLGKSTWLPFNGQNPQPVIRPLDRIHSDILDISTRIPSLAGARYILSFIDKYT